jgi:phage gp37-like protein
MSLISVQSAIVSALETALSPVKVATYPGRFDLEQLQRYASQTPCCLVATLGGPVTHIAKQPFVMARFAVFCLTTDLPSNKKSIQAATLAEAVTLTISNSTWSTTNVKPPQDIQIENLYQLKQESRGISLYVVSWKQVVPLNFDVSNFVEMARIDTDFLNSSDSIKMQANITFIPEPDRF